MQGLRLQNVLAATRSPFFLLGFGLALLVILVIFSANSGDARRVAFERVNAGLQLQNDARAVLAALQDAETGQRGYLLTGEQGYLEPYRDGAAALNETLDRLDAQTTNNPRAAAHVAQLRTLSNEKMAELSRTVELTRLGRRDDALDVLHTGAGRALMDRVRAEVRAIIAEENGLVEARLSAVQGASASLARFTIAIVAVIIALAIFTYFTARATIATLSVARDEAEDALSRLRGETESREGAEEQVRQLQKMEAVGQLTGGVAHDFNNMIAVITSALHLARRRLERGDGNIQQFLDAALDAAQRAATLTSRLLAFSRRSPLQPSLLDLNRVVSGMSELLRRTLGETVEMETVLAGGLWRTYADPSQLENAIVNLCVNARDAMADGGKLTIETANCHLDDSYSARHADVPAGQYVQICVSDTGAGMDRATAERAFDPFFTTKPVGRGTGLGLSQVYGYVKQTGGHVKIYSELNQGTTVKIYLPRSLRADEEQAAAEAPLERRTANGELVLVVEDDERVRVLTVASMRELGYTVIHAADGAQALERLAQTPGVILLFTDVVMPGMSGRALAEEALRRNPQIKVLYTTGYTQNAIVHNGVLDPGAQLLMKPFTLDQLAAKVRDVIES